MVQNLKKVLKSKISKKKSFLRHEVPFKAKNNREAVVVCMCICVYVYIYIYMFICSELIEETGRPPGLIFGMWGYFWPGSDKFES